MAEIGSQQVSVSIMIPFCFSDIPVTACHECRGVVVAVVVVVVGIVVVVVVVVVVGVVVVVDVVVVVLEAVVQPMLFHACEQ